MRTTVLAGVWVYMMAAVLTEADLALTMAAGPTVDIVISILAASQAVAIVLFYMDLKNEPGSLRLFALIPLMFLAALLIAMVASLG